MSGVETAALLAAAGSTAAPVAAGTVAAGTAAAGAGAGLAAGAGAGTGLAAGATGTALGTGATAAALEAAPVVAGATSAATPTLGAIAPVVEGGGVAASQSGAGLLGSMQEAGASMMNTPLFQTTVQGAGNPVAQVTANTFSTAPMSMAPVEPTGGLLGAVQEAQAANTLSGMASPGATELTKTFTVGDGLGLLDKANKGYGSVNKAMGQPQQGQPMMMDGGGQQQQQRQSFGSMVPGSSGNNNFARMLYEQKLRRQQGLLG